MNALSINRGNFLTYYWEELKRMAKNFVKIYDEFMNGAFANEPTKEPLNATEEPEELPKYLWI
jgi:hypothetical protein